MLKTWISFDKTAARATAVRRTCPPPSPKLPSTSIILRPALNDYSLRRAVLEERAKQLMEKLTFATKERDGTWFGVLIGDQGGLIASSFSKSRASLERHLRTDTRGTISHGDTRESDNALDQMINLYKGKKTTSTVPLEWESVSEFQKNVCQRMMEIPKGRVTSYGLIARRISSGPRAVGTGVARNPWPLFIPCHRVVPASL